jgi:hypothetical protein
VKILPENSIVPKAIGLATDIRHAPRIRTQLQALLPDTEQAHMVFDAWKQRGEASYLILVIELDAVTPLRIFVADGPASLRRQFTRAVRSLKGMRCAWILGLADRDLAITDRVIAEICARRWEGSTLLDATAEGHA